MIRQSASLADDLRTVSAAIAGTAVWWPGRPVGSTDAAASLPSGTAAVITTSGSQGAPRSTMLPAAALLASATATAARLGGHGTWLLALPTDHVAGLQVLVRSVVAGTTPHQLAGPFTAAGFAAATELLLTTPHDGLLTSLVPTQLRRVLADPVARAALTAYRAVLVGGAGAPPQLLTAAEAAGARIVVTYGSTETCGGCVYDGLPLEGVAARVDHDGRVWLAGPTLATGYLDDPAATAATFVESDGERWLRTPDSGRWADGRLEVTGRIDDMIVTGGLKVAPAALERLIVGRDGVAEACVVGVPDAEWGEVVVAMVVDAGDTTHAVDTAPSSRPAARVDLPAADAAIRHTLGAHAAPKLCFRVASLPALGSGKVDRRSAAQLAAALAAAHGVVDHGTAAPDVPADPASKVR